MCGAGRGARDGAWQVAPAGRGWNTDTSTTKPCLLSARLWEPLDSLSHAQWKGRDNGMWGETAARILVAGHSPWTMERPSALLRSLACSQIHQVSYYRLTCGSMRLTGQSFQGLIQRIRELCFLLTAFDTRPECGNGVVSDCPRLVKTAGVWEFVLFGHGQFKNAAVAGEGILRNLNEVSC